MGEGMKKENSNNLYSTDEFNAFMDFVKSHGVQIRYSKGQSLNLEKAEVGFVLSGLLGIYYKGTGKFIDHAFYGMPAMEDDKIMSTQPFYCRTESDVIIAKIPIHKIFEISHPDQVYRGVVFSALIYSLIDKLANIYDIRHGGNGYKVVKELIELYLNEMHITQGLANYILKRTNLSNSYVFKILATLKKNGYIEIKNARLTKILKPLPNKI